MNGYLSPPAALPSGKSSRYTLIEGWVGHVLLMEIKCHFVLFICGLFNDADSISSYWSVVSNSDMIKYIIRKDVERSGRGVIRGTVETEGINEENQNTRYLGRDLNRKRPEYR